MLSEMYSLQNNNKNRKLIFLFPNQAIFSSANYDVYQQRTYLHIMKLLQKPIEEQVYQDSFHQLDLFEAKNNPEYIDIKLKASLIGLSTNRYNDMKKSLVEMATTVLVLPYNAKDTGERRLKITNFFDLDIPQKFEHKNAFIMLRMKKEVAINLVKVPKKILSNGRLVGYNYGSVDIDSAISLKQSASAMKFAQILSPFKKRNVCTFTMERLKELIPQKDSKKWNTPSEYKRSVIESVRDSMIKTKDCSFYYDYMIEKKGREFSEIYFHFKIIEKVSRISSGGNIQQDGSAIAFFSLLRDHAELDSAEIRALETFTVEMGFYDFIFLSTKFLNLFAYIKNDTDNKIKNRKAYIITSLKRDITGYIENLPAEDLS